MGSIVKTLLDAVAGVSTPLTLVAFVAALIVIVALYWIIYSSRQNLRLLLALPMKDRGKYLPTILRSLPLEARALSDKSQTQVTLLVLKHSFWIRVIAIAAVIVLLLSLSLLAARTPPLPWQAAAYEIEEQSVTWDLRNWRKVSADASDSTQELTLAENVIRVVKLREDVQYFTARIGTTSKWEPSVAKASVPARMSVIRDTGVNSARTWQLVFDISSAAVMEPFSFTYTIQYVNAFQGQTQEWAAITTLHPTRTLRLVVLFPPSKPQKNLVLYVYPRNKENKRRVAEGEQQVSAMPGRIEWLIAAPRLNWNYVVEWAW